MTDLDQPAAAAIADLQQRVAELEATLEATIAQKPKKANTFAGLAVLSFLLIVISWVGRGVIERKAPTTHEVIFAIAGLVLLYTDPYRAADIAYKRLGP